jgi:hypothetical protein
MEANAEEMSMTEIRNLEETVTYALAAIRVNSQLSTAQQIFLLVELHELDLRHKLKTMHRSCCTC